jgi:hypothetical protein
MPSRGANAGDGSRGETETFKAAGQAEAVVAAFVLAPYQDDKGADQRAHDDRHDQMLACHGSVLLNHQQ